MLLEAYLACCLLDFFHWDHQEGSLEAELDFILLTIMHLAASLAA